jgi:hypothetical protein
MPGHRFGAALSGIVVCAVVPPRACALMVSR